MTQDDIVNLNIVDFVRKHKTESLGFGSIFILLCLIFFGGILASGILLGLLSSIGFGLLFYESKNSVPALYALMVKYPFWTDVISTILLGAMFGTSVNGLIASAVFGITNTVILSMASKYDDRAIAAPSFNETIGKIVKLFQKGKNDLLVVDQKLPISHSV
jgi:hypothetical protein